MEELVGFHGALQVVHERGDGDRGRWRTHELIINPTNNGLDSRTQHFVQPDICIIPLPHNTLWIHLRLPFQHPSDPPLPTDVFPQSVRVESVRSNFLVVSAGIYVWTRVEEHQKISMEYPTTYGLRFTGSDIVISSSIPNI